MEMWHWLLALFIADQAYSMATKKPSNFSKLKSRFTSKSSDDTLETTSVEDSFLQGSTSGVSQSRITYLTEVAKNLVENLKGLGKVNEQLFMQLMLSIKNDNEFNYVSSMLPNYGVKVDLVKFIDRQLSISKNTKRQINTVYQQAKMLTRLKV